jgi:O-antigen/teichoic acid export membrane protein
MKSSREGRAQSAVPQSHDSATPPREGQTGRHTAQSVLATACIILVNLGSGIVAARALGVSGRGELAAVILWPAVLASLAELGFATAFTYLTASRQRGDGDLARLIIPLLAVQCLGLYVVGVAVILLALSGYSPSTRATAIGFLLVYAPLYLAVRYLMALNQGAGRMGVYNLGRLVIPVTNTVTVLVLLAADEVSVPTFAAAYAGSFLVGLVVVFAVSKPGVRAGALAPHLDRSTTRAAWSVGFRTFLGSLAPIDTLQLDLLLVTSILGATDSGLYYVATSAGALVRAWGTTLGALSLPRVASSTTRQESLAWAELFSRVTVVCSGLVALVALLFARPLLDIVYGDDYTPAATLVRILAVGMLAASLRYVLGDGLRGLGRHSAATRAEVTGWISGGVALALFLPLWGVTGIALAVTVAYVFTFIAMLQSARGVGMRLHQVLVPGRSDLVRVRSALGSAFARDR